jgi:hypothetical protein
MKNLLVFLLVFLFAGVAHGADYYVDADADPGGDGTTTALSGANCAWDDISDVDGATFSAGDTIYFQKGDSWRGTLTVSGYTGTSGNPITFTSYGTADELPLIMGSVEKNDTGDWSDETGNVWSTAIAAEVDVGNIIFNSEASVGVKEWNSVDLDAQGEFWYDDVNHELHIYSTSNPASYYSDIECALDGAIITINSGKDYITIDGLALKYGGSVGIFGMNGDGNIIRNCEISYCGGGDQYGGDSEVRYGNGITLWRGAENYLIEKNKIWEIYDAGISNQGNAACTVNNVEWRYNVIWNCNYCYELFANHADMTLNNIYLENNTCYNGGGGWSYSQPGTHQGWHIRTGSIDSSPAPTNIYFRNNIFYEAQSWLYYGEDANLGYITLDYNVWVTSNANFIQINSVTYDSEDSEIGTHNVYTNPNFVNETTKDLSLQSNSPAINAGTDPFSNGDGDQYDYLYYLVWSDTSDSAVGPWADGVEIGAYGFVGGPAAMIGF